MPDGIRNSLCYKFREDCDWWPYKILYSDNMVVDLFKCNEHSSGVQLRFRTPFYFIV